MGLPGIRVVGDGSHVDLFGTSSDDEFVGSPIGEVFYTGLGDDIVYAGGGNDIVFADIGNDWLSGGTGDDRIDFVPVNNSKWADAAEIGVTVDLEKSRVDFGHYGIKTIFSFEHVVGTNLDDTLSGTSGRNQLTGLLGNDRLDGRSGDDDLFGNSGDDTLIGGSGNDLLDGGLGKDRFFAGTGKDTLCGTGKDALFDDGDRDSYIYSAISYSGTSDTTRDSIYGFFDGADGDKIDLSGIDANGSKSGDGKFTFIGSANLGSNDTSQVQVKATGKTYEYMVKIDIDTDNGSEMQLLVYSYTALTSSDFIL